MSTFNFKSLFSVGILSPQFCENYNCISDVEWQLQQVLNNHHIKYDNCDVNYWKDLIIAGFILMLDKPENRIPIICALGVCLNRLHQSYNDNWPSTGIPNTSSADSNDFVVNDNCIVELKGPLKHHMSVLSSPVVSRLKTHTDTRHLVFLQKPINITDLNDFIMNRKSCNTQLHILEWYSVRGLVWPEIVTPLVEHLRNQLPTSRIVYQTSVEASNVLLTIFFDNITAREYLEKCYFELNITNIKCMLVPFFKPFCKVSESFITCKHNNCHTPSINRILHR